MYKSVCVAVILLTAFAFTSGSRSADASPTTPPSPVIVARGKLVNQTNSLQPTTIFTPANDGLYRLSVYATVSTADPNSSSGWSYTFSWTDDAGPQYAGSVLAANNNQSGQFYDYTLGFEGGIVRTFEAKGGTSIAHSLFHSDIPDNSAFSLYYTLERLE